MGERETTAGPAMVGDRPRPVDANELDPAEWDRLAARSPQGHVFQSHAWSELKRPLGWQPRRFVLESGGEPLAVVSFQARTLMPRLPGSLGSLTYLYAPRGPILLQARPDVARTALMGIREVAARLRAAVVTMDPSWPADGPLANELRGAGYRPALRDVQLTRTGMLVPLFPDEADQHRLLGGATAKHINRARRRGAAVERIEFTDSHDLDALDEMHGMLVATAQRRRFPLRDREYLMDQWRALAGAGHMSLWFARVGGRRWIGNLLLHCGATLLQFYAASADEADPDAVPANHLLQWEIIRWAAGAGFAAYDLGGIDAPGARGLPGDARHPFWNLYRFKRSFGAEGVEFVRAHEYAPNPVLGFGWRLARRVR